MSFPSAVDPATVQSRLPSMTIPLRFVLLGLLSLFTGIGLLVARPDLLATYHYNQYVIAFAFAAALGWLSLTVLAGLYLAASKCWNFSPFNPIAAMHAHAHLGGLGVFVMLIVGIAYKLIPMFVLSDLRSVRRAAWSLGLLNAGLLGLFFTILWQSRLKPVFAAVAIAGLALYGLEIRAILRTRTRRVLDWGVRYFLTAIALLAPLSVLGLVLAWPGLPATALTTQLENVYGFLGLFGVVAFAILGMLYKIVPFLVWFRRYSGEIGRAKVPSMAEMYSERWQVAGYWIFVSGLAMTSVATALGHELAVRGGCALLAASLAVFALNMAKVLSHWIKPRVQPAVPARTLNASASPSRLALT